MYYWRINFFQGAFTTEYRKDIIQDWIQACKKNRIQCSEDFTLTRTLGDPVQVRIICHLHIFFFSFWKKKIICLHCRFVIGKLRGCPKTQCQWITEWLWSTELGGLLWSTLRGKPQTGSRTWKRKILYTSSNTPIPIIWQCYKTQFRYYIDANDAIFSYFDCFVY